MSERAIVLLSGGMDSTTLLYYVLYEGYEVEVLIFDYGQKHRKEMFVAQSLARDLNLPTTIIAIPDLGKLGGSALTDPRIPVPAQADKRQPDTVVPMRNSHFLCWAASVCEVKGIHHIFIGANAEDHASYPDCRPEFYEAMQEALRRGSKNLKDLIIHTPFIHWRKAQIVALGLKLGVPYERTWTCYQGGVLPCRICDACREREAAFEENGITDPLLVHLTSLTFQNQTRLRQL
jgi:7-cyano-7-deazaguanine synthase